MTLGAGGTDSRFLPAAYIQGSFLALPEHTLAPFRADAAFAPLAGLANYAGTYDLLTDADIPSSARALGLDPALHCTEVFLNGTSLGKKAWPPYVWEIPEAFRGSRARLTVRLSTSAYPLSGYTALLDGEHPDPYWVNVRPGVYAFCGLRSHPILYRN